MKDFIVSIPSETASGDRIKIKVIDARIKQEAIKWIKEARKKKNEHDCFSNSYEYYLGRGNSLVEFFNIKYEDVKWS